MRRLLPILALAACSTPPDDDVAAPDSSPPNDAPSDLVEPVDVPEEASDAPQDLVDETAPDVPEAFETCEAYGEPEVVGALPEQIPELSGLAISPNAPGILWGHNDSGDRAQVYAFTGDGTLLATVSLDGVVALDWEDMAIGPCGTDECVYVGDIGDNLRVRPWVSVHRFPVPAVDLAAENAELTTTVESARFEYPDGNHDAEAMVVDADGRVVLLTKDGRILTVFAAEFSPEETTTMTLLGSLDIRDTETTMAALVTGADIIPRERLLVRTYETAFEYPLDGGLVSAAFETEPVLVPVNTERQGEAIAYGERSYWHASEDLGAAITVVRCAE